MPPKKSADKNQRYHVVSVMLRPAAKQQLDAAGKLRAMPISRLLGRLIEWFVGLSKTEQSVLLGLLDEADGRRLASRFYKGTRRDGQEGKRKKVPMFVDRNQGAGVGPEI